MEHAPLPMLLQSSCYAIGKQAVDFCLWVVVQAFVAAVHSILRSQTSALNHLPAAVKRRRQGEHVGTGQGSDKGGGHALQLPPMTVLEVVLHTQRLQVKLTHSFSCTYTLGSDANDIMT